MSEQTDLPRPDGAVDVPDGPDEGALWHCGSPLKEQRALAAGQAWVDLSHRDVVRIAGKDVRPWLHAITAQDVIGMPAGVMTDVLILDAQGHIRFAMEGRLDVDNFTAHTEPGQGQALAAFLRSMVFAARIEVSQPDNVAVAETGVDGRTERMLVARDQLSRMADVPRVGMWASEALRIAQGRPRWLVDTDERSIPNELGLFGTALDKGCYPGQETVGRVHTLGRPPRRLVRLSLDGSEDVLPTVGADVVLNGKVVGRCGSAARHYEEGPVALALVKRNVPVEAVLAVAGVAATQEALVDPEVGLHIRPQLG